MRLVFYLDYDKFQRQEAPAILPFIHLLRETGTDVEFASSESKLIAAVKRGCDAVAISVFSSIELRGALKAAVVVKKINPRIVNLVGGQGVNRIADRVIHAMGVDVVVEGEGERILPALLQCLEKCALVENDLMVGFTQEDLAMAEEDKSYFGKELRYLLEDKVLYRSPIPLETGKKIVTANFWRDVSHADGKMSFPVPVAGVYVKTYDGEILKASPDYAETYRMETGKKSGRHPPSLSEYLRLARPFPTEEELNDGLGYPWDIFEEGGWKTLSLYAQRGCNWSRCSYCGISTPFGRRLSPSKVVEWLKQARHHGVTMATFEDDQFLQSKKWIEEMCSKIIQEKLQEDFQFGAMIRVDAVRNDDILVKLRGAGFAKLQIGVESLIPEKIRYFRKTAPGKEREYVEKARELVKNCLRIGIQPGLFIITTRPKKDGALVEVAEELREVSQILLESYEEFSCLPTVGFNDILMAYPGAPLLDKEAYKRVLVPLGPEKTQHGLVFSSLPIPYIFELKSTALANFIGNLREISRRRGLPPEMANETLEHLEDLIEALEISAEQLVTELGIAIKYVESMDIDENERTGLIRALITRELSPQEIFTGEDTSGIRISAEEERERVMKLCSDARANLMAVENSITREVNEHLINLRSRLKSLETSPSTGGEIKEDLDSMREETAAILRRAYPLFRARRALESLLDFIDEFERLQRVPG
jgi:radical SAM superfamily enzyme YgiQ (UPF0313 family)